MLLMAHSGGGQGRAARFKIKGIMVNSLTPGAPKSWAWFLAKRVAVHVIAGALATALVGALCVGAAGAVTGWILDLRSTPATWDDGFTLVGALLGLTWGAYSGVVGAIICGWAGLTAPPSRSLWPARALLRHPILGQVAGTGLASATFFAWELVQAQLTGPAFGRGVERDVGWILFGAPALMLCGAIAGALIRPAKNSPSRHRSSSEGAR